MTDSILNRTLAKAGADPVLMVSPAALDDIRHNTDPKDWQISDRRETYRGAFIEIHDEWSWGWMVRDREGQFIYLREDAA